ncbi:MAG TPA: EF-hand domain-containing protein [Pseudonocardiaceae bacterium]|nr:EF-hand domain-containing protein [Pseudonocardiaceae bacterium]
MASEFQRAKIAGVFQAMDVDGDGYLCREDFVALSDRWTDLRGLPPGSPGYRRLNEIMMGWWTTLLAAADPDRSGDRITFADVLTVVDALGDMPDAVADTADAMFDAVDENGDGAISAAEYHQLVEAWNGVPTDTDAIFPLLDRNGDGHLDRAEFTELWSEFWAGDDPAAPGTWVFGRFPLPA